MASKADIDQDALAAEWGLALEAETSGGSANAGAAATSPDGNDEMAAQWAAMIDDGSQFVQAAKGGAERILNQEEIDSLLGFSLADINLNENSGIRAIIDSAMVSYERLPMLEIVFDRLVRLMTTSLRNFTSDNVEVSLDRITSVRFGDYLNSIPLPAILAVFKAEEWDNFGLFTVDSSLIYSIIDVLLGGRRGQTAIRIEGRPYTTIETSLVKRMVEANVGSLLFRERGRVVGIVTERDYLRRVALERRGDETTPVREAMTSPLVVVTPETPIDECMAVMTDRRIRHLPVVEGGQVVGMVSIGDVVKYTSQQQSFEIKYLTEFISGR